MNTEKKKIEEIVLVQYGECGISTEPTRDAVQKAIDNSELDSRNYQTDLDDLKEEWFGEVGSTSITNQDQALAFARAVRRYHSRRVAYFVVNGWIDPIHVNSDGVITDGSHRIRAAMHKGVAEVEVFVVS